jgi:hypothetical protein
VIASQPQATWPSQGLHIPEGTEGTVAEDRASELVVFFDNATAAASVDDHDLSPVRG